MTTDENDDENDYNAVEKLLIRHEIKIGLATFALLAILYISMMYMIMHPPR